MESFHFNHRSDGKQIAAGEQKEKLLGNLPQGNSIAEVARFYCIRAQVR
jgi:hypothetical protein